MTNVNSFLKNLLAKHGKEFRKKELNQKKPNESNQEVTNEN